MDGESGVNFMIGKQGMVVLVTVSVSFFELHRTATNFIIKSLLSDLPFRTLFKYTLSAALLWLAILEGKWRIQRMTTCGNRPWVN